MAKTSVPCEACGKPVYKADDFCESCGHRVSDETKERIQLAIRVKREAREEQAEQEDRHRREREVRVKKAAQMVGILAVLFFLGGLVGYLMAQDTKSKALANLAGLDANATVTLEGINHNVGELRTQVENEPLMVLASATPRSPRSAEPRRSRSATSCRLSSASSMSPPAQSSPRATSPSAAPEQSSPPRSAQPAEHRTERERQQGR